MYLVVSNLCAVSPGFDMFEKEVDIDGERIKIYLWYIYTLAFTPDSVCIYANYM